MKIAESSHHLEHMIRQTRAHHVQLSQMVDTKAQMLVTVSAVIIPLTMQYLDHELLAGPAALMIVFMVLTICFAAYAVMPGKIQARKPAAENPLFNPLFFGDFCSMEYPEYLDHMEEIMNDTSASYEAMLREIYGLGLYLVNHKYKYVRYGYRTFILGFTLSLVLGGILELMATEWFVDILAQFT